MKEEYTSGYSHSIIGGEVPLENPLENDDNEKSKDIYTGKNTVRFKENFMKKSALREIVKVIVKECVDMMQEEQALDEAKKKKKDKKWIQKAVNPEHKGYCTPMTKSTCTPKRKALAKRFKSGEFKKKKKKNENVEIFKQLVQECLNEKTAPGWEGTVKAMKQRHGDEIDNPWALTHWMNNKGYKSHIKEDTRINKLKEIVKQAIYEIGQEDVDEASYKVAGDGHQYDTAEEDKARTIQTDPEVNENEASYKVVAPRQARVQKDDHARTVQRQTDMTEQHKIQTRSFKTSKDGLQNPKNIRDPKVN